ncbi:MAG: PLD nuclease N-terminal domain-containing protein [Bacteroidota bacterium]
MNAILLSGSSTAILIIAFLIIAYFGLIIFCLFDAVRATFNGASTKLIWVLVILFAPFIGSILYLTIGRNSRV